ncbi:NAD(P)/FAD-dependent oxidoreductase [Arthrobacter sp. A5]|uniref:NAD(P)/FAD-dependent oxidoreductase n=1 Tax=Arthrobacter sp. A5 TaxID=576926 RepID=UPI003DA891F7
MNTRHERILIVGNGLAAISAAERLRETGFTGELVMIGDEPHGPYNRTPLSKGLLTGSRSIKDLPLRTYTPLDARWMSGAAAAALDITRRTVTLDTGADIGFDKLVIATGVRARHLPGAPMHSPHVWALRTLADARAIDRAMTGAVRIAIIGGGFIGCEIASTARERGLAVTLIDRSPTLLHRELGNVLGAVVGDLHRRAGVRLHLGVGVAGWTETGTGARLQLDDGETVTADAAVVGVGTEPSTGWLHGSGLDTTNGVLCDESCTVLDIDGRPVEGIVAAGDVARWPNHRFDATPRRVEHWINAIEMGRAAADTLAAGPGTATPYTPVPRFWSHQHGVRIQSAGMPSLGTAMTILEGSVPKNRFLAGFTNGGPDGRLVGAVAFDAPRALLQHHDKIGSSPGKAPNRAF